MLYLESDSGTDVARIILNMCVNCVVATVNSRNQRSDGELWSGVAEDHLENVTGSFVRERPIER